MNLRDKYENGSILSEEYVLPTIIKLGINKQIPIFLFLSMSSVQFLNKLIPIHTQIDKEKLKDGDLSPKEWDHLDQKTKELYNAPLWLNDIEVNSVEDYKWKYPKYCVNEKQDSDRMAVSKILCK